MLTRKEINDLMVLCEDPDCFDLATIVELAQVALALLDEVGRLQEKVNRVRLVLDGVERGSNALAYPRTALADIREVVGPNEP